MARPYLSGSPAGAKVLTASETLTTADSGKIIFFTPPSSAGALVVTLPACNKGTHVTVVQTSDFDTAACKVLSAEGNNLVGGIMAQTGTGDNSGVNVDYIEFGSGTVEGDYVSLASDGSKWYVVGCRSKLTSGGLAFKAS